MNAGVSPTTNINTTEHFYLVLMRKGVQKVFEFFNVLWETNVREVSCMDKNITLGDD